jgi:hypothetical protein
MDTFYPAICFIKRGLQTKRNPEPVIHIRKCPGGYAAYPFQEPFLGDGADVFTFDKASLAQSAFQGFNH